MNLAPLPTTVAAVDGRRWESFQPYYEELQNRELTPTSTRRWLEDWSRLYRLLWEVSAVIYIEKSLDTADQEKEQTFLDYVNNVYPQSLVAEQALKERLLKLDVPDPDMKLVLRNMRNEADLFREANVPLLAELQRLGNEYDKITGAMKVNWEGEEKNLSQMTPFLKSPDRAVRERAWKLSRQEWLNSRAQLNDLYRQLVRLRHQVALNAGLPDYRAYIFRQMARFDYTPADCFTFHKAIEAVVVPAAQRILERKRQAIGVDKLQPWDYIPEHTLIAEPPDKPQLKPYQGAEELTRHSLDILTRVDPELGRYFRIMAEEKLLDLDTRPGKALGGYCSTLALRQRPFIFMNGVGTHDDVQTLLHEAGHAFHVFETAGLPLVWQTDPPLEFCEVASMSMELLAAPYLAKDQGGFYTPAEVAQARIEHLEGILLFLPYMAVVDAFQHWVYTHPDEAAEPANCDATYQALCQRFLPGLDGTGYEEIMRTGWQRKGHIFDSPFYYIEYGLAQVGALQVWRNALSDQAGAVAAYRRALAAGCTGTLPELFALAGAEFRFDAAVLGELVALVEGTLAKLRW